MGLFSFLGSAVGLIPGVGPLVAGGAKVVGGLLDNKSDNKAAAKTIASNNAAAAAATAADRAYDRQQLLDERAYNEGQLAQARAYDAGAGARNIASQLEGVEAGAEKYGYNRLTLLQGGQTGGGGSSGAAYSSYGGSAATQVAAAPPPLSSNSAIQGALAGFDDIASGDKARRDASNQLQYDLGVLQLEKLRSGVVAYAPSAATAVDGRITPLGGRAATLLPTPSVGPTPLSYSSGPVEVPRVSITSEYIASNGEKLTFGVGPDPEELIAGGMMETSAEVKKRLREGYGINTENASLSRVFDAAGWMLKTIVPASAFPFDAVQADRAKKAADRADALARYKKDKAAGKIPAPVYIKPYK